MAIPSKEECISLLEKYANRKTVMDHSISVANLATKIAENLEKKGYTLNKDLIVAAALLHDIKKLDAHDHVKDGAEFLKGLGYEEVAEVVKKHGFKDLDNLPPQTIEEKIVFYADKRDEWARIVPLEERFEKLEERYGPSLNWPRYYEFTKTLERELLVEV